MLRSIAIAAAVLALSSTPSLAANQCRDGHGKFVKCPAKPAPAATGARCKDAKGRFAKCGTPVAMPIVVHTTTKATMKTSKTTTKSH